MPYWWLLIPMLTAFAGWLIHRLAVSLMFRPLASRQILSLRIQGWIPRHRAALTAQLGAFAAAQFQGMDDIEKKIADPSTLAKVMPSIEAHIDDFLRVKLAEKMPVISMFIGDKTVNTLKTVFLQELEQLFPKVMGQFAGNLRQDLDIQKIITDKLSAIPDAQLEVRLRSGMGTIIRQFCLLGAVTGFISGLLALACLFFLK